MGIIASIDQGNMILDKGINIREKQVIFHLEKKVKKQLGYSCPSLNCNFKTLVKKEIKDHMQSVHKRVLRRRDIRFLTTSQPNVKSQKEILESKSFQDYVAGLIN